MPEDFAASLTLADTCLWIDPLDGTLSFVRNELHQVSILIGIAVRDRPVAGVILEPFVGGPDGTVTYGAVGVGVFGDRVPAFGNPPDSFLIGLLGNQGGHGTPRTATAPWRSSGKNKENI